MKKPKIIIKRAGRNKKQFMVVVVGTNGRVLLTSELLSSLRNCKANIKAASIAFNKSFVGIIKMEYDHWIFQWNKKNQK